MIENYIFDFGQVIVNFDTEYLTSIYIKEPKNAKIVEKVVFDRSNGCNVYRCRSAGS